MTLTQPLFLFNFRDFILDTRISKFLDIRLWIPIIALDGAYELYPFLRWFASTHIE